jgi:hypothetical protein
MHEAVGVNLKLQGSLQEVRDVRKSMEDQLKKAEGSGQS